MIDARTTRVLGALVAAMTLGALFLMAIEQAPPRLDPASIRPAALNDRSFELSKHWERVVVHTSKGGSDSLPMRCHFIVRRSADANGQWVDRTHLWQLQEPGRHLCGFNTQSIGICVMTNGEADTMSRQQFEALVSLVQGLQRDLRISASGVCLRNELPGGTGMMRSFPAEEFETRLLRQVK
jgi:hypothetical protein